MAQQIAQSPDHYTFRTWNPNKISDADNTPEKEIFCPILICCCNLVENYYKQGFHECISFFEKGIHSDEQVFEELKKKNQYESMKTRVIVWFFNVIGHILIFNPILPKLMWIPLAKYLVSRGVKIGAIIIGTVWGTLIHFMILSVAWCVYSTKYAAIFIAVAFLMMGLCFIGVGAE